MRRRICVIDRRRDEKRIRHFARQSDGRIVVGQAVATLPFCQIGSRSAGLQFCDGYGAQLAILAATGPRLEVNCA